AGGKKVAWSPGAMREDADPAEQQAAALGGNPKKGQRWVEKNGHPRRLPADPKPSLVQVLHPRGSDVLAHDVSEAPEPLSASRAHPGDGGRNQLQAEQIGQELRKPILRQKVIVQQIDHKGTDPRAILNWRCDALGEWGRRDGLAFWAAAAVGAMFGHHDFRLGQIENLPGLVSGAHLRRHLKGAVRAALGIMVDDDIRILDLTQGLSSMTFLPP